MHVPLPLFRSCVKRMITMQAMPQAPSGSGGSDVVDLTLEADGDAGADELAGGAAATAAEPRDAGSGGEGAAAADGAGQGLEALVDCSTTTPGIRLHKRAPGPLCWSSMHR